MGYISIKKSRSCRKLTCKENCPIPPALSNRALPPLPPPPPPAGRGQPLHPAESAAAFGDLSSGGAACQHQALRAGRGQQLALASPQTPCSLATRGHRHREQGPCPSHHVHFHFSPRCSEAGSCRLARAEGPAPSRWGAADGGLGAAPADEQ